MVSWPAQRSRQLPLGLLRSLAQVLQRGQFHRASLDPALPRLLCTLL